MSTGRRPAIRPRAILLSVCLLPLLLAACSGPQEAPPESTGSSAVETVAAIGETFPLRSGSCNLGAAGFLPDGRAAVLAWFPITFEADGTPQDEPTDGVVDLPHADWDVRVVQAETDLGVSFCDNFGSDGVPVFLADHQEHPVVGGTLELRLGAPAACGRSATLLLDVVVDVDGTSVPLEDVELVSNSFGCIAG